MISIAGLQRTGTNYVAEVIEKHLGVPLGRAAFWKHLMPQERTATGKVVEELLHDNPALRVVLVVKQPVMWLESVLHRTTADLHTSRAAVLTGQGDELVAQLGQLYGDYYASWFDRAAREPRIATVRYEDVLAGDHGTLVSALGPEAPAEVPDGPYTPIQVSHSLLFTPSDRERYLRQETVLPAATLDIFLDALGDGFSGLYGDRAALRAVAEPASAPEAGQALHAIRSAVQSATADEAEALRPRAEHLVAVVRAAYADDPAVSFLAGRFLQKLKQPQQARALFEHSLALLDAIHQRHPDRVHDWMFRATVLASMRQPEKAREVLEHALHLAQRDRAARLQLGALLLRLGEPAAALDHIEQARAFGAPKARCDALAEQARAAMA